MTDKSINQTIKLSKISFGCSSYWSKPFFSEEKALKILHKAYENNVNYFHTAPHYNVGEKRLGNFIKTYKPKGIFFSTAAGRYHFDSKNFIPDLDTKEIEKSIDSSLKNMNLNTIDIVFLYGLFKKDFSSHELTNKLSAIKNSGKVKFFGIFGMNIETILPESLKHNIFDAYMFPHSISHNNNDIVDTLHHSRKLIVTFGAISTMKNYFKVYNLRSFWYFLRCLRRFEYSKKRNELINFLIYRQKLPNNNHNSIQNLLNFSLQNKKIHSTLINTCDENHLMENLKLMS